MTSQPWSELVEEVAALDDRALVARFHHGAAMERAGVLVQAAVVAEVERRGLHLGSGHRSVRGWVRMLTRGSGRRAHQIRQRARLLAAEPVVASEVASGRVGVDQLDELARARANPRCGDRLAEVLPALLSHAGSLPFEGFRACVRRWETLADADGSSAASEAANQRRSARVAEVGWSTVLQASWGGVQGAEVAAVYRRFLEAERCADLADARSLREAGLGFPALRRSEAQRAADAVHRIFVTAAGAPPEGVPAGPSVTVTVDLATMEEHVARRCAEATGRPAPAPDASELSGRVFETGDGQLLHPSEILATLAIAHLRRAVLDPAGIPVELSRHRRLFEGTVRDAVLLQAARCVWPGCEIPASVCDTDHAHPWEARGPTVPANGVPLCPHHHRHRHRTRTRLRRRADGSWHAEPPPQD